MAGSREAPEVGSERPGFLWDREKNVDYFELAKWAAVLLSVDNESCEAER